MRWGLKRRGSVRWGAGWNPGGAVNEGQPCEGVWQEGAAPFGCRRCPWETCSRQLDFFNVEHQMQSHRMEHTYC